MEKNVSKLVYWLPRVLAISMIGFLALFSLDIFEGNYGFWGTIVGLLMHNIPVFILIAVLLVAWKYEWVGGVVFILFGLLYLAAILRTALADRFEWHLLAWAVQISGPLFLIGALFFVNWFGKKNQASK